MNRSLQAVRFDGLHTDSLGHFLAGLGLFLAAVKQWPELRACWREGRFMLLGESLTSEQVENFLATWKPSPYGRWWTDAQKEDTKAQGSLNLRRERNKRPVADVRLLDAHIVSAGRNRFNRVLGTGGNIGKRDLAKAFTDAKKLLANKHSRAWLRETLTGEATVDLPDLTSAGTWFVFASKTFNSGQGWYREGRLSPWSFLLSLEGAMLISGSASRKLGAHARPYAAFPFLSEPPAPASASEIGLSKAEFWAPLWEWPANLSEIRALFQRGLARLGDRAAQAPHEFAVAALAAGVDGGVREFARYELRQTTSSQVYEAIPLGHVPVAQPRVNGAAVRRGPSAAQLLLSVLGQNWFDRLPREPADTRQKGVTFTGLRAPIENAITRIGQKSDDPERWQRLLLELAKAQMRIDLNKALRDRCQPVPLLDADFFRRAWPEGASDEIRLARAIASIGAAAHAGVKNRVPVQANIFGVETVGRTGRYLRFVSAGRPARAVWHTGDPLAVFGQVVRRRLIDAEPGEPIPLGGTRPVSAALLRRFLSEDSALDLETIARWVPALSLIDWSRSRPEADDFSTGAPAPADGTAMLDALFRPFFHAGKIQFKGESEPFINEDKLKKLGCRAAFARRLFSLIAQGSFDEAGQLARNRYLALGRALIEPPDQIEADPARLSAALLISVHDADVTRGLSRWLQPEKNRS